MSFLITDIISHFLQEILLNRYWRIPDTIKNPVSVGNTRAFIEKII